MEVIDPLKAIGELGLTVGLLVTALWYIVYRTVQRDVYSRLADNHDKLVDAVAALTTQLAILLDREKVG